MKRLVLLCALTLVSCGKSSPVTPTPTPTPAPTPAPAPTNRAPVITSATVTPGFGIASLTQFSLTGRATDADGDALTYTWAILDPFNNVIGTDTGPNAFGSFSRLLDGGLARLTVTDGRGGSVTADSARFTVGSMATDWVMMSSQFPGQPMLFLTLQQSTSGQVTGDMSYGGVIVGHSDPAGGATIDANGNLRTLRVKFTNGGVDFTISGQMQPNLTIPGTVSNTTATFQGRPINGLQITLSRN